MKDKEPKVSVDAEVAELADLFIKLVVELNAINKVFDKTHDQLAACEAAVLAVKHFLDANDEVFVSGITWPLGALAAAVRDVQLGAKPKLFHVESRSGGGRPPSRINDAVKATAAACLEILHKDAKQDLTRASEFVVDQLMNIGISRFGSTSSIDVKTVRGWRDEMGARNSAVAMNIYRQIIKGLREQLNGDLTLNAARRITKSALAGLVAEGLTPPLTATDKSE